MNDRSLYMRVGKLFHKSFQLENILFCVGHVINPHQRCGYSDSPFARKDTFLCCRVQKWIWGNGIGVSPHKKHKTLSKRHVFVMGKYFEDIRQDEKHVLDLLESIMRPKLFVKEELRPILLKMKQIWSKIKKIKVSAFWIPEIQSFPAGGQC